ncbi:MAG: porin [Bacteroidetes bacterium]|nr:porin [Bacteroidota bacterium]
MIIRFLTISLVIALSANISFSKNDSLFCPIVEGTIRPKYEYRTNTDEHRFQIRNARFSVNGNFSKITSYKAEIDLSDEGVTKMLDAYLKFQPKSWYRFTIGQQKIPFSTDNIRSPHELYFANRSFIGKQLSSKLRDVGATAEFINKEVLPLRFFIGVYNGTGLYNQKSWRKSDELSFASRITIKPASFLNFSFSVNSKKPSDIRMTLYNGGFFIDVSDLHFEMEYYYKTYQNNLYDPTKGFFAFLAYNINLQNKNHIQKITPLIRYDMMTNNFSFDVDGNIKTDIEQSRITGGFTFSLAKPFLNDIRLNYEHFFFKNGIINTENKLVLEFVVRF